MWAGEPLGGVQRQNNLHLFRQSSRSKGVGAAENQFSPGKGMQGGVAATSRLQQDDVDMVPGHEGIAGNERADELARRGLETPLQGPEPAVRVAGCQVKTEVAEWMDGRHISQFGSAPGMSQTKVLISGPDREIMHQLLEMSRGDIRRAVGLLTGHCSLMRHLQILGKAETGTCRKCEGDEETPIHVICECPVLAGRRLKHLGPLHLEPSDVTTFSLTGLLAFVRDSGLV